MTTYTKNEQAAFNTVAAISVGGGEEEFQAGLITDAETRS